MSERYFVDQPISLGRVVLGGPEAHHLIHVMRATPGRQIVLFDGSGAEFPPSSSRWDAARWSYRSSPGRKSIGSCRLR